MARRASTPLLRAGGGSCTARPRTTQGRRTTRQVPSGAARKGSHCAAGRGGDFACRSHRSRRSSGRRWTALTRYATPCPRSRKPAILQRHKAGAADPQSSERSKCGSPAASRAWKLFLLACSSPSCQRAGVRADRCFWGARRPSSVELGCTFCSRLALAELRRRIRCQVRCGR